MLPVPPPFVGQFLFLTLKQAYIKNSATAVVSLLMFHLTITASELALKQFPDLFKFAAQEILAESQNVGTLLTERYLDSTPLCKFIMYKANLYRMPRFVRNNSNCSTF